MLSKEERTVFVEELVLRYHDELAGSALKRLPNYEDAEDAMNELWYMVVMKADDLYRHPNQIGWLYTSLGFCIKRFYTKNKERLQEAPLNDAAIEGSLAEGLYIENDFLDPDKDWREKYRHILSELEMRYIQYRFDEGMSNEEISRIESKSYSAITSIGNRAGKKIKKFMSRKFI